MSAQRGRGRRPVSIAWMVACGTPLAAASARKESPLRALAWAMALLTLSTDGSRIAPRLYRYRYRKASQIVSVPAQRAEMI